jgi:diadenylate cyclase
VSGGEILRLVPWRDLVDILLVAVVVYNLLLLIRGTRAVQILLGILFVGTSFYLARMAGLNTLETILEKFLIVLPFAILVLFQHEIRRALASFGRNPFWRRAGADDDSSFQEVVLATTTLASRRVGALIVLERLEGLRDFVENGVRLDAAVSFDLLISIFTPGTPLHDGAAIIRQGRLAAAACFLPLTQNAELSKEFGTRHRAALGISEETDAVAVVVSEETGVISLAFDGQMTTDLDAKTLRNTLYKLLVTDLHPRTGAPA